MQYCEECQLKCSQPTTPPHANYTMTCPLQRWSSFRNWRANHTVAWQVQCDKSTTHLMPNNIQGIPTTRWMAPTKFHVHYITACQQPSYMPITYESSTTWHACCKVERPLQYGLPTTTCMPLERAFPTRDIPVCTWHASNVNRLCISAQHVSYQLHAIYTVVHYSGPLYTWNIHYMTRTL